MGLINMRLIDGLRTLALAAGLLAGGFAQAGRDGEVDRLMSRYQGQLPGASVMVIQDGQPVLRRGYGLANLEDGTAATPTTNYRLASITKQFTAACILLLAEDGKLSLEDPVKRWLPSLPAAADTVTLRHLLSHTSGLIDYEDAMPENLDGQLHDADVLRILEGQDRGYFPPGSDYRYSNSGYALLALVVARASGQDFASFLRQRIFIPLGMDGTVALEEGRSTVARRAFGYSETDGRWVRTDQSPTSAVLGDGGIYSSIDDLAKWDAALYDERLLKRSSLNLAFSRATSTTEPDVPFYGFGWRINGETLWHSGESIGFRNVIVRYPQQRLSIIVLSNRNDPEPYKLALAIARVYLPGP
jgi:CubicO group peptidase (beta-lactamase class C family)